MASLMQFLEIIVSVAVGGMIPVFLFALKERWEAQARAEDWFVEKYIENSIDLLHDYFCRLALLSSQPTRTVQSSLASVTLDDLPYTSASKLIALTGGVAFQNWLNAMKGLRLRAGNQGDWNGWLKFQSQAMSIASHLDELRQELLSQKVRSKSDVYKWRRLACVTKFKERLGGMTDEIVSDPNVTKYVASDQSGE